MFFEIFVTNYHYFFCHFLFFIFLFVFFFRFFALARIGWIMVTRRQTYIRNNIMFKSKNQNFYKISFEGWKQKVLPHSSVQSWNGRNQSTLNQIYPEKYFYRFSHSSEIDTDDHQSEEIWFNIVYINISKYTKITPKLHLLAPQILSKARVWYQIKCIQILILTTH